MHNPEKNIPINEKLPDQELFIENIAKELKGIDSLDKQKKVAESIYDILFIKKISQLNETEKQILATLLDEQDTYNSYEILKLITTKFPQTTNIFNRIWKHRNLFPKAILDEQRQIYLQQIQKNIFELFQTPSQNGELQQLIQNLFWIPLLQKIKHQRDGHQQEFCQTHFQISKYQLEDQRIFIECQAEKEVHRFENYIIPLVKELIKNAKLPRFKISYSIKKKSNKESSKTIENHKIRTENPGSHLQTHMQWDACHIPNKQKIYDYISNPQQKQHSFIQAEPGTGKTHFLQATTRKLRQDFPQQKIIYIQANDFLR
ncbi:MAG: hypothetical protein GXP45_05875 [bacterium]|nr:hypothetical protein [bacterium]